jgi:hypothetical protein
LADIDHEIDALGACPLPDARGRVHSGKTETELAALFKMHGYDASTAFPAWLADLARLSEAFIDLAHGEPVTARLESMDGVRCPRFHVDNSYLRLVCTYRGPGTEWLEDEQVDRGAHEAGASNDAIIRFGEPHRMPEFTVGLMKGRRYPGHADAGLVHRSPLPDPAVPARILFSLDC